MARLRISARSLSAPISVTQLGTSASQAADAEKAMRAAEYTSAFAQQVRQINLELQSAKDNQAFQQLADGDPASFISYITDRLSHTDKSAPDYQTLHNMLIRAQDKLDEQNWQTDIKSGDKTYEDFLAHLQEKFDGAGKGSPEAAHLVQQISQVKQAITARDQAKEDHAAQLEYIEKGDNGKYRDYLIQRLGKTSDAKTQSDIIAQIKQVEARQTQEEAAQRAAAVNDVIVNFREGKYSAAEAAQRLQTAAHDPKITEAEVNHIQAVTDAIFSHAAASGGAAGKSAYEQSVQTFSDAKAQYDDALKNPSAYSVQQWQRILDNVNAAGQAVSDQGKAYAKQTGNAAIARQASQVDEFIGGDGMPGTAVLGADNARFKAIVEKVATDSKDPFQQIPDYLDHAGQIRAFTALVPGDNADLAKGRAVNVDLAKAHTILTDVAKTGENGTGGTNQELKAIGAFHNAQDKFQLAITNAYNAYKSANPSSEGFGPFQWGSFKPMTQDEFMQAVLNGDPNGAIANSGLKQSIIDGMTKAQTTMDEAKVDATDIHTEVTGAGYSGAPENRNFTRDLISAAKGFASFIPPSSTMGTPQNDAQWWDFANGRTPSGGFYDENIDSRQMNQTPPGMGGPKTNQSLMNEDQNVPATPPPDLSSLFASPGSFNEHMWNTSSEDRGMRGGPDQNEQSQETPPMVGMGSDQRNELFGANDAFSAANDYLNTPTTIDIHGFGLPDLIDLGPTYDSGESSTFTDPNIGTGFGYDTGGSGGGDALFAN